MVLNDIHQSWDLYQIVYQYHQIYQKYEYQGYTIIEYQDTENSDIYQTNISSININDILLYIDTYTRWCPQDS